MKPISGNSYAANPPVWLSALALLGLSVALYFNLSWPWGVLFIYWAIPSILSGQAFLIGPIDRGQSPILFWIVTVLWVLLGLLMILADGAPSLVERLR